jgi:cell division protein FtsB
MPVPTIWSRLSRVLIVLLFAAGATAVGLWYLPEIRRNEELQAERLRLERQEREVRERGEMLRAQIQALTNNPAAVERLIRERFGYARPGELVVHFEPPASNSAVARR